MGSRGGLTVMDRREVLCRNSWVRRWLWRLIYDNNFAVVTKSLNSPWRPQNTYRLKSSKAIGRPIVTIHQIGILLVAYTYNRSITLPKILKRPLELHNARIRRRGESLLKSAPNTMRDLTIYHNMQYIHWKRGE
jgi:hypothetical protein